MDILPEKSRETRTKKNSDEESVIIACSVESSLSDSVKLQASQNRARVSPAYEQVSAHAMGNCLTEARAGRDGSLSF